MFIVALLIAISYAQTEPWSIVSEESNMFCNGIKIINTWNNLGFHNSLETCAEACIEFEGCNFSAWRTDSGQGQCTGYSTCELMLNNNHPDRRWIVIERVVADEPALVIDQCDPNPCGPNADCTNTPEDNFECTCHPGFVMNVGVCDAAFVDECDPNPCGQNADCTNKEDGGFDCTCQSGFVLNGDVCEAETTAETTHDVLKSMVKTAFDNVKSPENRNALPGLIRKAFHDAGHFDKSSGEVRMGCIQHFLSGSNACPQHANLEEAEAVLDAVMSQIPSGMLSMADAVQLLGALAVDELAKDTEAPSLLYNRVRTGRVDPQPDECISDKAMCNNLPAFFTRHHSVEDHEDIVVSLNDVWDSEIQGKMVDVNSLSKQDAVALIGAHTVGRHFEFGHWTQHPNSFDNEYFLQLKRVKDWLDSGKQLGQASDVHPFGFSVRSNWWIDSDKVEDENAAKPESHIMMLDADLALVLNAPELIEKYAADITAWRQDFDDAYIVMSELGFASLEPPLDVANRRLLQRAEELLDEDFEFFQNLQILREEQVEKIHAAFRRKM